MKVLLLNPYLTVYPDDPASPANSLSLGYLAAYLLKHGHEVKVVDIAAEGAHCPYQVGHKIRYGLGEEKIKRIISDFSPHIVGITNPSTLHAQDAFEVAEIVKEIDASIPVVFGGAHTSAMPSDVLKNPYIDIAVVGEGEETLLEIVNTLQRNEAIENITGTYVKKNGSSIITNPLRPVIKDPDIIPFPARHLLPVDIYSSIAQEEINYCYREKVATMITSRGCPGDCVYCAVKSVWGRRWRGRSAQNVVDEIEMLMKDYGVGEIHFLDDSISVNKNRLYAICKEIIRRKIDVKWTTPNGIAIWLMDKELIKIMKQAGCYRLTFGLESGNEETLKFIGKKYDYLLAKEIIKYCHQIGLWTVGTFIIGFPYEQIDSINDTINFALNSYLDFAVFYIANPLPGTRMYEIFKQEGFLDSFSSSDIVRGTDIKYYTHNELKEIQGRAFSVFLKRRMKTPWRGLTKIRSWEDLKYTVKIAQRFAKMGISQLQFSKGGIASLWK